MAKRRKNPRRTPGEDGNMRAYEFEDVVEKIRKMLQPTLKRAIRKMDTLHVPPKHAWRIIDRVIQDSW